MMESKINVGGITREDLETIEKDIRKNMEKEYQEKLEKSKKFYQTKLSQLEKKAITLSQNKIEGSSVITRIVILLYYIKTKIDSDEFRCPYCEYMLQTDIYQRLLYFYELLNISESKFKLIEIKCDWADRELKDTPYDRFVTSWGENWWFAQGIGIHTFPAIDVLLYLKDEKYARTFRTQGIGQFEENPETHEQELMITIVRDLSDFIENTLKERSLSKTLIKTISHKQDTFMNDGMDGKKIR